MLVMKETDDLRKTLPPRSDSDRHMVFSLRTQNDDNSVRFNSHGVVGI